MMLPAVRDFAVDKFSMWISKGRGNFETRWKFYSRISLLFEILNRSALHEGVTKKNTV